MMVASDAEKELARAKKVMGVKWVLDVSVNEFCFPCTS